MESEKAVKSVIPHWLPDRQVDGDTMNPGKIQNIVDCLNDSGSGRGVPLMR